MTPDHAEKLRAAASAQAFNYPRSTGQISGAGGLLSATTADDQPGFLENLSSIQGENEAAIERIKNVLRRIGAKSYPCDEKTEGGRPTNPCYGSHMPGALMHARAIRAELFSIEEILLRFAKDL